MHDACLFVPPPTDSKNIKVWSAWAIKDNYANMFNPEFIKMMALSKELEASAAQYKTHSADIKRSLIADIKSETNEFASSKIEESDNDKIILEKGQQSLEKAIAENKTICRKYDKNQPPGSREAIGASGNIKAAKQIETLSIKKLQFYADQPFKQLNISQLTALYNEYNLKNNGLKQFFTENGISVEKYHQFLELNRSQAGTHIPDITITGESVNHPGFYLKKLNAQNETEAAFAACLGKLSNCCQSLSGEMGEPCVIHGLTSPHGGFFVVCKGDVNNPLITDEVMCQSWVWRSKEGALVLDSIEAKSNNLETKTIAKDFYFALTQQLITQHEINQVSCGLRSGISKVLLISDKNKLYFPSNEIALDYKGYSDSSTQFMVASRDTLYLIPGQETEFFKKSKESFSSPLFLKTIVHAIQANKPYLLEAYLKQFPFDDARAIVNDCKNWIVNLHSEKNLESVSDIFLLEITNEQDETALLIAARLQQWDVLKSLILKGANINVRNKNGETALMWATGHSTIELSDWLILQGADKNAKDKRGLTSFLWAAIEGNVEQVKWFIANDTEKSITPDILQEALGLAADYQKLPMLDFLATMGVDIDGKNFGEDWPLVRAVKLNRWETATWLISNGADLKTKNSPNPILLCAVTQGKSEIAELLLSKGADVNEKGLNGNTALLQAASMGNLSTVQLLASKGGEVNMKNSDGMTPLLAAASKGNAALVEWLALKGGDVKAKTNYNSTAILFAAETGKWDLVDWLALKGSEIDIKDNSGQTAFMKAAEEKNLSRIKWFISKGADVNSVSFFGMTALQLAATKTWQGPENLDLVKYLILNGAHINSKDKNHLTALMHATLDGNFAIVEWLNANGADINAKDLNGDTAIVIAANNGHWAIVECLSSNKTCLSSELERVIRIAGNEGNIDIIPKLQKVLASKINTLPHFANNSKNIATLSEDVSNNIIPTSRQAPAP